MTSAARQDVLTLLEILLGCINIITTIRSIIIIIIIISNIITINNKDNNNIISRSSPGDVLTLLEIPVRDK